MRKESSVIIVAVLIAGCSKAEAPSTGSIPGNCVPEIATVTQNVIEDQLAAFGNEDFELARSFSSRIFRSNVTTDAFDRTIRADYAFLLSNPIPDYQECLLTDNSRVGMTVSFENAPSVLYQLVNEDGGWRIDVAGIAQGQGQNNQVNEVGRFA